MILLIAAVGDHAGNAEIDGKLRIQRGALPVEIVDGICCMQPDSGEKIEPRRNIEPAESPRDMIVFAANAEGRPPYRRPVQLQHGRCPHPRRANTHGQISLRSPPVQTCADAVSDSQERAADCRRSPHIPPPCRRPEADAAGEKNISP